MTSGKLLRHWLPIRTTCVLATWFESPEAVSFEFSHSNGSHRFFKHPIIREFLNLQPDGGQAKAYQVRQFIRLVRAYNLKVRGADE